MKRESIEKSSMGIPYVNLIVDPRVRGSAARTLIFWLPANYNFPLILD